ncbi:MAG: alpha/beta hydrolase [Melioribacteraceae bacterium]
MKFKSIFKFFFRTVVIFVSLIILFIVYNFLTHGVTPKIVDKSGNKLPKSVSSLEEIKIGGVNQYILIRGEDKNNPLLLFLHGGPAMPAMYLAHKFQRDLEKNFVVVQWDRRCVGKSYNNEIPIESLNLEQLISDTKELVIHLTERFHKKKIYLVGHSWGTFLGMFFVKRYPEYIYAYIGTGQLGENDSIKNYQDDFIISRATEENNTEDVNEIKTLGSKVREKLLFKYGGELYNETSWWPFMWEGIKSSEYTLYDFYKMVKGLNLYSEYFSYGQTQPSLPDNIKEVDVPVFFFLGKHDYTTPFQLSQKYFDELKAPLKKIIWFNNSAHFPFYEEPYKFSAELQKIVKELDNRE